MVQVELSSIEIEERDVLVVLSEGIDQGKERALGEFFSSYDFSEGDSSEDLCRFLFPDLVDLSFAMVSRIGPRTIYLSEVLGETPRV